MTRNRHRVPASQWRKWTQAERTLFNNLYESVLDQRVYNGHPKSTLLTHECWKTIAWNVAWQAADQMRSHRKLVYETVDQRGYKPPTKRAA